MVRIITDSTSDISQEEAKVLGIDVVPLTVAFGDEAYIDGVTIKSEDFYDKLINGNILPKTSQPSPLAFEEIYKPYVEAGDDVISLHISSELSGTVQAARIAASEFDDGVVTVIDSLNVTGALNVLVRAAAKLASEGKSKKEVIDAINDYIPRLKLYVIVNTLEYLKKGGRIKPSAATVGDVLSLHPVLTVRNGFVEVEAKVIGDKATVKWLTKQPTVVEPEEGLPILLGHSGAIEKVEKLEKKLTENGLKGIEGTICLGSVVGTYAGPGSIGMFYIAKK